MKFEDIDIRTIIQQPLKEMIKTISKLPAFEKVQAIVGGEMTLATDNRQVKYGKNRTRTL